MWHEDFLKEIFIFSYIFPLLLLFEELSSELVSLEKGTYEVEKFKKSLFCFGFQKPKPQGEKKSINKGRFEDYSTSHIETGEVESNEEE